ncbi:endonuclease-reverse transcriptase [Trichonephila clavipes]|nr:endonuclease-reverse transcriptase [Trichonephila clavipes]
MNLETIRALETFERKALRTIFGPVKDQGCWRTRYNFELYRLYKEPQVTQVIRSNRLRWLGHIWRSPENNQTRAYTFKNPMGSRTRGRPPTRWIDEVENDLKTLNIKNWQRVAVYRWNWRKRAVEAVKTCNRTATAGSDVVQSGRPIFDDFFQHLWPYIGNNTANVVFQMVKRLWLIRIDQ